MSFCLQRIQPYVLIYVIKKYVLMAFCLQRIQPYVFVYVIKNYVLLSFCLQRIQPYVFMYGIKNYVLMSFCLQRIRPDVLMYVIKKYVFMSFCLQNMALRNMSFCHSVYRISRSFNALFATVSSSSPSSQKLNTQLYAACFNGRLSPCSVT